MNEKVKEIGERYLSRYIYDPSTEEVIKVIRHLLFLIEEKEKEIEELKEEQDRRERIFMRVRDGKEKAETRIKELEDGIHETLGESTISYTVEKRLRKLIEKE